jgi:flagellin
MSLSILNNISALQAENQLSITTAAANKSLQQLSSGSRINSGSDDAAGLAISDGLNANVAALNQSSLNATNAIGSLQTADGALSQVTALLNRSITLATEASNSGLSTSQSAAINTEYQALLTQITNISSTTNFNGTAVFGGTTSAFLSDDTSTSTISATVTSTSAATLGLTGNLSTSAAAQTELAKISTAISTVSAERGSLGATVEQLQAASTVATNESQNLVTASSSITSADISTVVANDTKYSILQQTGISALQQANQQAQTVLKLLQ